MKKSQSHNFDIVVNSSPKRTSCNNISSDNPLLVKKISLDQIPSNDIFLFLNKLNINNEIEENDNVNKNLTENIDINVNSKSINNSINDENKNISNKNILYTYNNSKINKLNEDSKHIKNNGYSKSILNDLSSEINIKNLKRPFSIYLHSLAFKKDFNCNNDKLKDFFYKLNLKIQIYCGSQEYTKPRTLEWKSLYFHKNRHIGKAIEFDLDYDTLPMFASIVFKIKFILFNKQKKPVKIDNVFWTNFKLFDHNRRLKTGSYFIL